MSKELIAAKQALATLDNISVYGNNLPCTFIANGLSGGEEITFQIQISDDTYIDMYIDGLQAKLTSTNNVLTVIGPGEYKISKPVTTGNVGVHMASEAFK